MQPTLHHHHSKLLPRLGWLIAGLFVLFQVLLQTSTSIMITDLEKAFSINVMGVSLLSSSFFYTYLFLQIPAGIAVDRFGAKAMLTVCLLLAALSCILFASAKIISIAVTSRILLGLASAPAVVATLYLAARWFPSRYFALLAGLVEMLAMLGGVAGEILMARCVNEYGWRATLSGCGVLAILMAILAWLLVRDCPDPTAEATSTKFPIETSWQSLMAVVQSPQAWVNGIFCGLIFAILASFAGFWCVPYLMQRYGISLNSAADASAVIFLGAAIGAPSLGWLSDRIGQYRSLMITAAGVMLATLVTILLVRFIPLRGMFILLFILGFGSGSYVLPFAVMRDINPIQRRGTAMGYTNLMCLLIGSPILQPCIGWILSRQQQTISGQYSLIAYEHALLLLPICLSISLMIAFFVREETI